MNEATIIKTLDLPGGQRWELYADANVIALAPGLTDCERDQALDEVCAHWRQSTFPPEWGGVSAGTTQPLASLPHVGG